MLKKMAARALGLEGSAIEKAVNRIQEVNINFLAIDFDQTFIDIHTGGVWQGTLDELVVHVRPEFRDLVVRCLQFCSGPASVMLY